MFHNHGSARSLSVPRLCFVLILLLAKGAVVGQEFERPIDLNSDGIVDFRFVMYTFYPAPTLMVYGYALQRATNSPTNGVFGAGSCGLDGDARAFFVGSAFPDPAPPDNDPPGCWLRQGNLWYRFVSLPNPPSTPFGILAPSSEVYVAVRFDIAGKVAKGWILVGRGPGWPEDMPVIKAHGYTWASQDEIRIGLSAQPRLGFVRVANQIRLSWELTNPLTRLEASENLREGSWVPVQTTSASSFVVDATAASHYFRLAR